MSRMMRPVAVDAIEKQQKNRPIVRETTIRYVNLLFRLLPPPLQLLVAL